MIWALHQAVRVVAEISGSGNGEWQRQGDFLRSLAGAHSTLSVQQTGLDALEAWGVVRDTVVVLSCSVLYVNRHSRPTSMPIAIPQWTAPETYCPGDLLPLTTGLCQPCRGASGGCEGLDREGIGEHNINIQHPNSGLEETRDSVPKNPQDSEPHTRPSHRDWIFHRFTLENPHRITCRLV